jgi:hypothetical protein
MCAVLELAAEIGLAIEEALKDTLLVLGLMALILFLYIPGVKWLIDHLYSEKLTN